ncbi:hypothetical protein Tco_0169923 [Tanacetum coccineum]
MMEYYEEEDDSLTNFETEYPAIVFDDTSDAALSYEPMVSPLNKNKIDFRISFDESDDEDYMVIFDENSFSYDSDNVTHELNKKTTIEIGDEFVKILQDNAFNGIDGGDNEFPAIAYNDDLKSKSDLLIEPSVSPRHIDKFDLKNKTSLSEYDEEEQNVLYFNSFPLDIVFHNNLKSKKDIDDHDIDVTQSSGRNEINIDT